MLVSLYMLVFGSPGLPRMAGMSLGSLTTTKFLNGTRNLHGQVLKLRAAVSQPLEAKHNIVSYLHCHSCEQLTAMQDP